MRNFTKSLLALALMFVCVGGVNAKTVKKYLRLTDTNLNTSFWQDHTVNPVDGSVLNESEGNNSSIAWGFSPVLDASSYTSLVVNLKSGAPAELKIRIYDDGGFWTGDNVRTSSSIAAGETSVTINLKTIKKGDNSSLSLSNIKYVEIHNTSFTTTTYYIDEIYFTKEVDNDYLLLGDYTYGTLRAEHGYVTATSEDHVWGWQFNEGTDWSAYKYLVVVPKLQATDAGGEEAGKGTKVPATIHISNKTGEGFGEPIELGLIADWNPRRTQVFDLSTKEGVILASIGKLTITAINGVYSIWGLAAAYLTNSAPTYSTQLYNETDAQTNANYYRTSTTKGAYGTICLPYNAAVCGAEIYDVVGVDSKDSPSKLYLEQVDGVLIAGKAYLYKTNSTLNVTAYKVGEEEAGSPVDGNLHGTFVGATVPNDGTSYILSGGVWKRVYGTTNTVGANRAYLTLTDELVVPAAMTSRYIEMDLDGNGTTGISTMQNSERIERNEFYDLSGRRVAQPSKGLYIVNGKKVIIK